MPSVEVDLFDLGGVLIELGGPEELGDLVGEPSEEVLFLDDNPLNVEATRGAGLRAELARGPLEARKALILQRLTGIQLSATPCDGHSTASMDTRWGQPFALTKQYTRRSVSYMIPWLDSSPSRRRSHPSPQRPVLPNSFPPSRFTEEPIDGF